MYVQTAQRRLRADYTEDKHDGRQLDENDNKASTIQTPEGRHGSTTERRHAHPTTTTAALASALGAEACSAGRCCPPARTLTTTSLQATQRGRIQRIGGKSCALEDCSPCSVQESSTSSQSEGNAHAAATSAPYQSLRTL